ncbi:MAG TPA: TIGR03667 family PPOX class F420-dependent oxidoreductase [Acidimicrobiia bacterium]|nr:TIGR03667 family PPOX class F420-dependent oxidoreductase [Acidimicrobiia bacterium]
MFDSRPNVARHLDDELVGWLTTISPTGQPQSSVVWFLRDGDEILVYSQATARKLTNIAAQPKVAFNLRGDPHGDEVVTIEANATIDESPTPAHEVPSYLAKYEGEIVRLGWTPPEFAADYPTLIRLRIDRIRSWED